MSVADLEGVRVVRLKSGKMLKNEHPLDGFVNPAYRAPGVHTGPAPGCHGKKHKKKKILLQNHKAQSFHILYVAMFSGPLYKSCQSCLWGQKWPRPEGSLAPIDLQ